MPNPTAEQMIQTRTAIASVDPAGFIRLMLKPGAVDNLDSAVENVKAVAALNRGRKMPLLVDVRPLKTQEKAARDYYAGTLRIQMVSATALIIDSVLGTVLGNLHASVTSVMPFKLFRNDAAAVTWLKMLIAQKPDQGAARAE